MNADRWHGKRPETSASARFKVVLALCCLALPSCRDDQRTWDAGGDRSLEPSDLWKANKGRTIENGSAFDKADLDVGEYRKVIVPDTAVVRVGGEGSMIRIFMKKRLAEHSYPGESMSIRTQRKKMGCSVKKEGDALIIATHGEYQDPEGSADIRVVLVVPAGVQVEQRKGLAGKDRINPTPANEGWSAIPDVPDPDRQIEK
jgi:hypothetical protein